MAAQTALSEDMQKTRAQSQRLLSKHPGSIPVLLRKAPDADLPGMDERQFLVSRSMLCDDFKKIVCKHIIDKVGISIGSKVFHMATLGEDLDKSWTSLGQVLDKSCKSVGEISDRDFAMFASICLSACGQVLDGKSSMSDLCSQYKGDDFLLHMVFCIGGQSDSTEMAQQAASEATADMELRPRLEAEKKIHSNAEAPMSAEAKRIFAKHPNSIPVVCERASGSNALGLIKNRFLVPQTMRLYEFKGLVRKHVDCESAGIACLTQLHETIIDLILHSGAGLNTVAPMRVLYEEHRAADGFLYLRYNITGHGLPAEPASLSGAAPTSPSNVAEPVLSEPCAKAGQEDARLPQGDALQAAEPCDLQEEAQQTLQDQPDGTDSDCFAANTPIETAHTPDDDPMSDVGEGEDQHYSAPTSPAAAPIAVTSSLPSAAHGRAPSTEASGGLGTAGGVPCDSSPQQAAQQTLSATAKTMTLANAWSSRSICEEAAQMLAKYPDRVPVICRIAPGREVPELRKTKLLAPGKMLCSEFQYMIHQQLRQSGHQGLDSEKTIYLILNNMSPKVCTMMADLYDQYKADDGYLYVTYSCSAPTSLAATPLAVTNSLPSAAPGRAPSTEATVGVGAAVGVPCDSSQQQAAQQAFSATAETMTYGAKAWASRSICEEAARMLAKYPDRVPVICRRAPGCGAPDLRKTKFMVPGKMLCSEFKYMIHQQLRQSGRQGLDSEKTIYLILNNMSPKACTVMTDLYDQYKADDGYLYVTYSLETFFGSTS